LEFVLLINIGGVLGVATCKPDATKGECCFDNYLGSYRPYGVFCVEQYTELGHTPVDSLEARWDWTYLYTKSVIACAQRVLNEQEVIDFNSGPYHYTKGDYVTGYGAGHELCRKPICGDGICTDEEKSDYSGAYASFCASDCEPGNCVGNNYGEWDYLGPAPNPYLSGYLCSEFEDVTCFNTPGGNCLEDQRFIWPAGGFDQLDFGEICVGICGGVNSFYNCTDICVEKDYVGCGADSHCQWITSNACGDGKKLGAEECDDGGIIPGDGCSSTCSIEEGWTCALNSPSICERIPCFGTDQTIMKISDPTNAHGALWNYTQNTDSTIEVSLNGLTSDGTFFDSNCEAGEPANPHGSSTGEILVIGVDSTGDNSDVAYRSYISFDTSSIPDNAEISSVTLQLHHPYATTYGANGVFTNPSLAVHSSSWGPTLEATDWESWTSSPLGSLTSTTVAANQYKGVPLTSFSSINKLGESYFLLTSGSDSDPASCWGGGETTEQIYSSSDSLNPPKLVVQYKNTPATKVCYDEIFGSLYPHANPHDCTGTNTVLWLSSENNSHAVAPDFSGRDEAVYDIPVCYGDLGCHSTKGACGVDETLVVKLWEKDNSHISNASDMNYPWNICCQAGERVILSDMYWVNEYGVPTNQTSHGRKVNMTAVGAMAEGEEIVWEIWEDDGGSLLDNKVAEGTYTITLEDSNNGWFTINWTAQWEVDQSGNPEYFFKIISKNTYDSNVLNENYGLLEVLPFGDNADPTAVITGPEDGQLYQVGQVISFKHASFDNEGGDLAKATWSFGGSVDVAGTDKSEEVLEGVNVLGEFQASYNSPGYKVIILTVEDDEGAKGADYVVIGVLD
jgi:cysteine-rich repeat protein